MTDTPQGSAAAMLARTKRTEIQHFADGGFVRRIFDRHYGNVPPAPAPSSPTPAPAAAQLRNISSYAGNTALDRRMKAAGLKDGGPVKKSGARAELAQMPASHAGAPSIEHGGPVRGPGGPTADKVPLWGSDGEFMLPADTTAIIGKEKLEALVEATHQPTNKAAEKMGRLARADGGPIDDTAGAVTRVGNFYSGGNVSGPITVNGQVPDGTVSTIDTYKVPPPRPPAPVLGAPAAVTPARAVLGSTSAATAPAAAAAPTAAAAPASYDYANRNAGFNAAADARTAMSSQSFGTRRPAAPVAAPTAAPAPAAAAPVKPIVPVQSVVGYADGAEIEDPRKKAGADAAARLAGTNGRASVMAALAPAAAPVPTAQPAAAAMNALPAAPSAAPIEQAQVRRVDNAIAAAPTAAPAASPATPAAVAAPARVQMATPPAASAASERPNPLGGPADTNAQLATLQASNAAVPQGGAIIIDNAASEADRRAQFNEQANLGNALARTSWSPRRGTQVNDAAVAAAMAPIDARARMSQIAAKEAGDTQRAGIQERGADARARLADTRAQQALGVDQQRLALDSKRVTLDANRDDRAAAAAEVEQAQKARTAKLHDLVLNGTPAQQKMATGQLAALQGREVSGNAPPANYRWSADGTRAEPIPGGPADPAIKANKALTEDQAKSAGYAIRMEDALKTISEVAKTNPGATRPGVGTAAINMLPEGIANALRPEDRQRVEAAQLDALDAALTLATGAAYTKEQLHGLSRSYFAQPNDGDTTVAEKQARLNKIIETARLRAGPTGSAMADQIARTSGAPTAQPTAVASPADHANLPAGATYIAPDGSTRRKL